LGGDFDWKRSRILFRPDRGIKSAVEFMTRADFYNRQKMWGLAVIHTRSALGIFPDRLDCHMALVVAYMRLKRYGLAVRALEQAKRLAPDDPRLANMQTLLDEMLPGGERNQMMHCASCDASFSLEGAVHLDDSTAQCPHCGAIVEGPSADRVLAVA
jgi:hypothetical protein